MSRWHSHSLFRYLYSHPLHKHSQNHLRLWHKPHPCGLPVRCISLPRQCLHLDSILWWYSHTMFQGRNSSQLHIHCRNHPQPRQKPHQRSLPARCIVLSRVHYQMNHTLSWHSHSMSHHRDSLLSRRCFLNHLLQ